MAVSSVGSVVVVADVVPLPSAAAPFGNETFSSYGSSRWDEGGKMLMLGWFVRTSTQWGMDLAMRKRVDGFEMAIGRHFSAPGFWNRFQALENTFHTRRVDGFLHAISNWADTLAASMNRVRLPSNAKREFMSSHLRLTAGECDFADAQSRFFEWILEKA